MRRTLLKVEGGVGLSGSCFGEIINEIIRLLLTLKIQVPVPCDTLLHYITLYNNNNTLHKTIDNLNNIFKNISKQFNGDDLPLEVYVIFGPSPAFAREVYRIIVPDDLHCHFSNNHSADRQKHISKIIRSFMFSELQDTLHAPMPLTNMFVVLKKHPLDESVPIDSEDCKKLFSNFFLPLDVFKISKKAIQIILDIEYDWKSSNCCQNMSIFSEHSSPKNDEASNGGAVINNLLKDLTFSDNDMNKYSWLQSKIIFKGFRDPN